MNATDDQVSEAIRAYVQAGKRGCDMLAAMKCAVEAALSVEAPDELLGMKFVIDETLPRGTVELRGANTVRMTSIPKWEDAILPPGGNGGPPIEWSETELAMMEEINLLRAALTSR
jgi:hypothetical protein